MKSNVGFSAGIASVFTVVLLLVILPYVFLDQIELYVAFISGIYAWFSLFVISLLMQLVINKL